jgi:hypothetical protein
MNLTTTYLGIPLRHPLIIGSSSLTDDLETVKELEDHGAAALVLRSLYAEEIAGEQMSAFFHSESHSESSPEAGSYSPDPELALGPDEYLEHLHRVKETVGIPVIASLNGASPGSWISYARLLQQAGADALELDLYHSASDAAASAAEVERQMTEIVRQVKLAVSIPVAAKSLHSLPLSPTSPANSILWESMDWLPSLAFIKSISMWLIWKSCARWNCLTLRSCSCGSAQRQSWQAESTLTSPSPAECTQGWM